MAVMVKIFVSVISEMIFGGFTPNFGGRIINPPKIPKYQNPETLSCCLFVAMKGVSDPLHPTSQIVLTRCPSRVWYNLLVNALPIYQAVYLFCLIDLFVLLSITYIVMCSMTKMTLFRQIDFLVYAQ